MKLEFYDFHQTYNNLATTFYFVFSINLLAAGPASLECGEITHEQTVD